MIRRYLLGVVCLSAYFIAAVSIIPLLVPKPTVPKAKGSRLPLVETRTEIDAPDARDIPATAPLSGGDIAEGPAKRETRQPASQAEPIDSVSYDLLPSSRGPRRAQVPDGRARRSGPSSAPTNDVPRTSGNVRPRRGNVDSPIRPDTTKSAETLPTRFDFLPTTGPSAPQSEDVDNRESQPREQRATPNDEDRFPRLE